MEADRASQVETVDPVVAAPAEGESQESVIDLLEQLGRDLTALVYCEARLAATRHEPQLRRAARDVVAALAAALALLTAFALANAAAVRALSPTLSDWAAPLVLAAGWAVVGVLLALFVRARTRRLRALERKDAAQASREAEEAVRRTLERLSPAISREIAAAAMPMAGDVASGMAGSMVDAGEDLIEDVDEIVDRFTDDIPGGSVVDQVWDVVLMPGRFGVKVATTVLKRGDSAS